MGDNENSDINRSQLPRMYGALSGVATSETGASRAIIDPLSNIIDSIHGSYDKKDIGRWLGSVDFEALARKLQYEEYLNVPHVSTVVGGESLTIPRQTIETLKGHPKIFGKETSEFAERVKPRIFLSSGNPATIAHEVGHNVPSPISTLSTLVKARDVARPAFMGTGIGMAMSDNDTVSKYAPLVSVAPHIPDVLEEARASIHGTRAIRAIEGNRAAIKSMATLLPAFMTYVVSAIPALTAPMIAKAVKDYAEKKQEKTASKKAVGSKVKSARSSWITSPPKPKTSKIGKPGTEPQAPPSKRKFYQDMLGELNGLGTRKL